MSPLFDDGVRTDGSRRKYAEPTWQLLDRSAAPRVARVRELIDAWFAHLPPEAQRDLRGRLQSNEDDVFHAAFWELYLAEMLRRLDAGPEFHPLIEDSARRPDFLATGPSPFYLEATLAGPSRAERAQTRRLSALYDVLNRAAIRDFFIDVDVDAIGSRPPPARALRQQIDTWLTQLDADRLIAAGVTFDAVDPHALTWRWEDWNVTFRPLPKSAEHRSDEDPLIGMHSEGGGLIDTTSALRKALREKGGRYGKLRHPLVVGVVVVDQFVDAEDVEHALFGSEAVRVFGQSDRLAGHQLVRQRDGFWTGRSKPTYTRVSAALVALNLFPWSVASSWPTLWLNPWASLDLAASFPCPVASVDFSTGRLTHQEARIEPNEFFELPAGWPA